MNIQQEEQEKLICQKHGKKIKQIILDDNCQVDVRMLCSKCIESAEYPYNKVIGVDKAKEMIRIQLKEQSQQIIQPHIFKLTSIKNSLLAFQDSVVKIIEDIIDLIQKWESELNNTINKNESIKFIQGLQFLFSDPKSLNDQLEQNGKAYLIKLYSLFKRLLKSDNIQKCQNELISLSQSPNGQKNVLEMQELNQQKQFYEVSNKNEGSIKCKLINQVSQENRCNAIAFNNTGSIMIAGFNENIKVWQFDDGKINELSELYGKGQLISCLTFSKKNQSFVSGDQKGKLLFWKQGKNNKEWLSKKISQKHKEFISCILLNSKEDEIISCSWAKKIIVNYLDSENFGLGYSLEKKHIDNIYSLSLNESETALVSCGQDRKIILWIREQDNKWQYQNFIQTDNLSMRICFINESQFIVQLYGKGYSNLFQIENLKIEQQENQKILLSNADGKDDQLFPTIYNKKKNLILQKSDRYVYIISKIQNGEFLVQAQPIDCASEANYGSMTEDGEHIVIWNKKTRVFRIYRLNYE